MEDEPEAERIWVGVQARAKMSVGWAEGRSALIMFGRHTSVGAANRGQLCGL